MDKPNIDLKPQVNPLIATLPKYLKNPANFQDIQEKILATLATTCSHGDVLEMANCKKCTEMMLKRRKILKKLGFKNARQYMAWRRVHEKIAERFPLVDWRNKKFVA